MTKSTNKTIWTLGLVGVVVFLAWKLWPAIRNKLNGSGSGGGAVGATTAGSQYPFDPYGQGGGGGSQPGVGANFGGGPGGQSGENPLQEWLNQIVNEGYYNASQIDNAGGDSYGNILASDEGDLYDLDEQGLPLEPTTFGDEDQYLITQDVPGSDVGDYGDETIDQMTGDEGEDAGSSYDVDEIYSS